MKNLNADIRAKQQRLSHLCRSAAAGGGFLGTLIGVILAGPHFYKWPAPQSLAVVACGAVACGLLGYAAIAAAYGASLGEALEDAGRTNGDIHGHIGSD